MSTEDNKAVLRRLAEEFNKRNLAVIEEVFSPNFVLHDANHPHWPRGLEGARKMFTVMLTAAPNLQITVEDTVAEGDKVVVDGPFAARAPEYLCQMLLLLKSRSPSSGLVSIGSVRGK
jgi:predicted ester cyclase